METNLTEAAEVLDHRIPSWRVPELKDRLAKLDKKAAKLGCAPAVLTELRTDDEVEWHFNGTRLGDSGSNFSWHPSSEPVPTSQSLTGKARQFVVFTVTGEAPKISGWTFLAVIEHLGEDGNMVHHVPTVKCDLPVEYRDAAPTCDCCHAIRNRVETFVVRHENGDLKRVGRNCLTNFLGGVSPDQVLTLCEYLRAFEDACSEFSEGGYGSGREGYSLPRFLEYVVAEIRVNGWVSGKVAREHGKSSTAGELSSLLGKSVLGSDDRKHLEEIAPTDADKALAASALAWVYGLRDSGAELSDYEHNLTLVCRGAVLSWKHAGLAASVIVAYQRAIGAEMERKHRAETSQHVGTIGGRINLTVTVLKAIPMDSDYGPKTLYLLLDDAGNSVKWFATGAGASSLATGETYSVKATVAKHDEFKGVKGTLVKRVTVNPTAAEQAVLDESKAREKAISGATKVEKSAYSAAKKVTKAAYEATKSGTCETRYALNVAHAKAQNAENEAWTALQAARSNAEARLFPKAEVVATEPAREAVAA